MYLLNKNNNNNYTFGDKALLFPQCKVTHSPGWNFYTPVAHHGFAINAWMDLSSLDTERQPGQHLLTWVH